MIAPFPKRWRFPAAILLASGLVVLFMVGGASWHLVLWRIASRAITPSHSEYDPLMGWTSRPLVNLPDYYAPGIGVRINAQRLRADSDLATLPAPGRRRVICLGDSFTFGHGVRGEDTWPARLEVLDPRLEAVNMGQEGYGLDQMLLWYERDGERIAHQELVVAFIYEDIARTYLSEFNGYPVPRFHVRDGRLVLERNPLPMRPWYVPWLQIAGEFGSLRIVEALHAGVSSSPPLKTAQPDELPGKAFSLDVTMAIMERLRDRCADRGIRLSFVYLPTLYDLYSGSRSARFRNSLQQEAEARGVRYIDLTPDFIGRPDMDAFFLHEWGQSLSSVHYDASGNDLVARLLAARLFGAGPALGRS